MLMLSIFGVSMFIGYKYMNNLIENQPSKEQIGKWNMLYAALGSVFGLFAYAFDGVAGLFFAIAMGNMFGCILNNAIYQFKVK